MNCTLDRHSLPGISILLAAIVLLVWGCYTDFEDFDDIIELPMYVTYDINGCIQPKKVALAG